MSEPITENISSFPVVKGRTPKKEEENDEKWTTTDGRTDGRTTSFFLQLNSPLVKLQAAPAAEAGQVFGPT